MHVRERPPGDVERLRGLIRDEGKAKQRDRYRMALLAIEGKQELEIAELLGVAKATVEKWACRYRDEGIAGLAPLKAPGATPKLPRERQEEFKARILHGPRESDGVCRLGGKEAQQILNEEFGVDYSLQAVYDLLHRLNLSCLKPRPRHELNDSEKLEEFKASAPLCSQRRAGAPGEERPRFPDG